VDDQGPREADALAHPARELAGMGGFETVEADESVATTMSMSTPTAPHTMMASAYDVAARLKNDARVIATAK